MGTRADVSRCTFRDARWGVEARGALAVEPQPQMRPLVPRGDRGAVGLSGTTFGYPSCFPRSIRMAKING